MSRRNKPLGVFDGLILAAGVFIFAIIVNYWQIVVAVLAIVIFARLLPLFIRLILAIVSLVIEKRSESRLNSASELNSMSELNSVSPKTWEEIDYMNGHDFEFFVAGLLRENGFDKVGVTVASGDYGADIIAYKDGAKYAIQCKRFSPGNRIGLKPVQEIYAGRIHYNADIAVVVTNLYFTDRAQTLAEETDVMLWDRDKLADMIIKK